MKLVLSIAQIETGMDSLKVRYEPDWQYFYQPEVYAKQLGITIQTEKVFQAMSFGPLQIMGAVARELLYNGPLIRLSEPELGALYGCRKISQLCKKYPCQTDVISAYNQGTPYKINHSYQNQDYVDKVMAQMKIILKEGE